MPSQRSTGGCPRAESHATGRRVAAAGVGFGDGGKRPVPEGALVGRLAPDPVRAAFAADVESGAVSFCVARDVTLGCGGGAPAGGGAPGARGGAGAPGPHAGQ